MKRSIYTFIPIAVGMCGIHQAAQAGYTPVTDERFTVVGYGDVKFENTDGAENNAFSARFVPIFLFRLNDKIHIETETEISNTPEGETEVGLEYADLHYFATDTTTLTAGKFLLPFGQFSANQHPSWINRLPFNPGIYGTHGEDSSSMTPLLPVLSDTGIAIQQIVPISASNKIFVDLYLTNGPRSEEMSEEDDSGDMEGDDTGDLSSPALSFESGSQDNNKDKAFGARIAYAALPGLEIGASSYQAAYDVDERLDFQAQGIDLNWVSTHYLLRGEWIQTETERQPIENEAEAMDAFDKNLDRSGWYLQGTLMVGKWFPSIAGTEVVLERSEVDKFDAAERWAYGINYWLSPGAVVKVAYETTETDDDEIGRVVSQLSFGF